ncbi:MAG: hypothetical protein IPK83_10445 [Planctomycetes bacterium]|nr:hypothetical protein [Planctomycetota bacterium]
MPKDVVGLSFTVQPDPSKSIGGSSSARIAGHAAAEIDHGIRKRKDPRRIAHLGCRQPRPMADLKRIARRLWR